MCSKLIKVKYHSNYKKFKGVLIHKYNDYQLLPCGKCYECKEAKIEEWSIRWHEQLKDSVVDSTYMVTLTYNDANIPKIITIDGEEITTLDYSDLQKYIKRLRKAQDTYCKKNQLENPKIYYHACGEYGKNGTKRPHYHLLITNLIIPSDEIVKKWNKGNVHIGNNCNEKTIKYILKYTLKNSLEPKKIIKVRNTIVKKIFITPFDDYYNKFYEKLQIPYNKITIEKEIKIPQKLIAKIYAKNEENEYRVIEKSLCSKGIGSNFVTDENVKMYHKKPDLLYLYYDAKKKQYKQKPLCRYYKEKIYNPNKKDEYGKILYDDRKNPIKLFCPKNINYEDTPRFKRQKLAYEKEERQIQEIASKYIVNSEQILTLNQAVKNQKEGSRYLKNLEIEAIRKDRLKKYGLENVI